MDMEDQKPGKGRSTIAFPYGDISDAIRIAEGLLEGVVLP